MDFDLRSHPSSSRTFMPFESEFSANPTKAICQPDTSAVVAMEFVAPPVWFWLSRMNLELRRVGLRYI